MAASSSTPTETSSRPVPGTGKVSRTLFLMVGLPGSGKTTFSQKLRASGYFDRVSQDEAQSDIRSHGDRRTFDQTWKKTLQQSRRHLIVDRCNHNQDQRQPFISAARKAGMNVVVIHLDLAPAECLANLQRRFTSGVVHPSINDAATAARAVETIGEDFEPPFPSEGIQKIFCLKSFSDMDATLKTLIAVAGRR